jgi:hypothetical protein
LGKFAALRELTPTIELTCPLFGKRPMPVYAGKAMLTLAYFWYLSNTGNLGRFYFIPLLVDAIMAVAILLALALGWG